MPRPRSAVELLCGTSLEGAALSEPHPATASLSHRHHNPELKTPNPKLKTERGHPPRYPPILKLELTWNTALTIAKAMKPTKMKTAINTPLAITFVNMFSWLEMFF